MKELGDTPCDCGRAVCWRRERLGEPSCGAAHSWVWAETTAWWPAPGLFVYAPPVNTTRWAGYITSTR